MKINNILYTLCLIFAFISFSSCNDDDDKTPGFNNNVLIDIDDLEMNPGNTMEVNITDGNGKYTVQSSNDEIATATVQDTKIIVNGHNSGTASIIITDDKGVNGLIKVLVYGDLTLASTTLNMLVNSTESIKITAGNGRYVVTPSDPSLTASIETNDEGTFVSIKSSDKELTDATIKVSDKAGRSVEIKVNVKDPFTMIKDDATERIEFKGYKKVLGATNVEFFNNTTSINGYQLFGWQEEQNSEKIFRLVIPLTQDLKTVGAKTGAQILFDFYAYGDYSYLSRWTVVDTTPATQVLKYDAASGKTWIVFYYTYRGTQYEGVICMKIG